MGWLVGGDVSEAGGIFFEGPNPNALSLSAKLGEDLRMEEAMSDSCRERDSDWERDRGRVSGSEELTEEADEVGLTWVWLVEADLVKGIRAGWSGTSGNARLSSCV